MAKDILKEAIADAKAVREVALANAKAALEEAFTPKLQSMLSAKLSEELEDEDMVDEEYSDEDEIDMDEILDLGEDNYEDDMDEYGDPRPQEKDPTLKADPVMDEDYGVEDDMDEEVDLEEILNELELEEGDSEEEEEELEELARPNYKAEYTGTNHHYSADKVMESEEFDLDKLLNEINNLEEEDYSEGDTQNLEESPEFFQAMAGLAGVLGAAGITTSLQLLVQDPVMAEKYPKLAKLFSFLEKIGSALGSGIKEDLKMDDNSEELEEARKSLFKSQTALKTVKAELNEVNLLNSKLLYVNRIFKANTLDENQKLKVVETLDKAQSINEAKLIYETIKDTFRVANTKKVSARKKQARTLKENFGMASKTSGTTQSNVRKEIISESNNMVSRFQKLANITITE